MKKHSRKFYQKQYRKYKRQFKKAEQQLEARGETMNDGLMHSFHDFKLNYDAMREALNEEGSKASPVHEIVNDQKYSISHLETRAYQKLLKQSEFEGSRAYTKIRTMSREEIKEYIDWGIVAKIKNNLMSNGISKREADRYISQTYFGSK